MGSPGSCHSFTSIIYLWPVSKSLLYWSWTYMCLSVLTRHLLWNHVDFRIETTLSIHLRLNQRQFRINLTNCCIMHPLEQLLLCLSDSLFVCYDRRQRVNLRSTSQLVSSLYYSAFWWRLWRYIAVYFWSKSLMNLQLTIDFLPKVIHLVLS
jgi:hypothetical protein